MVEPRAVRRVIAGAPRDVEATVLETVATLAAELGTLPPGATPRPAQALDRDLGFGSLERAELLLRLEEALGVRFSDEVLAEAETVADLVAAAQRARAAPGALAPAVRTGAPPGMPAPATARTLTEVLAWHVETHGERIHLYLQLDDQRVQSLTYGELWQGAVAVGRGLRERGIEPGEPVALMLRTELGFFTAFFGVLLAGGVPVPLYPPFRPDRVREHLRRQATILDNARCRLLLTFPELRWLAGTLRGVAPTLRAVLTVDQLAAPGALEPGRDPEAPALVQYTSGSTGDPKGVLLAHANVLANIRALGEALAVGPEDVCVSWLPLYHDMGLIGAWLGSLHYGIPVVLLPPPAFLARPVRWLRALHAYRGTISPAPNFAFELCVRRIPESELAGLDLSAWRVAANGSEPVSAETIERFTRRFARWGFRPDAMCPVYGLAEAAVGLTVSPPGRPPRIDLVAREAFQRSRRADPAEPGDRDPLKIVSCGRPLPGHEIRIVDDAGWPVGERVEGRIQFRGPSVCRGYYRNPTATLAARVDGWMDSGDLGYLAAGELFVTGRQKDVIIKAGRNLHPQEIEEIVGNLPGIRKGCVAAFGLTDATLGTERLVVVAETRRTEPEERERLRAAAADAVIAALGVPPDTVVIAGPGAVLKTSSGKVRRAATREAYRRGDLERHRPRTERWRLAARRLFWPVERGARGLHALAYAAWSGLLLVLLVPPLAVLARLVPEGRWVNAVARGWCRLLLRAAGCRLRVRGLEHVPRTGGAVLVANHASYLDAVVLLAALPGDLSFVAKRELLRAPVVGTILRRGGHLFVERFDLARSLADAAAVTRALSTGRTVVVFPEGTFRRSPGLLPFRLGAFLSAVEAGVPVVPVTLRGTREILPAGVKWPRRGAIEVVVGAPLVPHGRQWREAVRLRDLARALIAAALGE